MGIVCKVENQTWTRTECFCGCTSGFRCPLLDDDGPVCSSSVKGGGCKLTMGGSFGARLRELRTWRAYLDGGA